MSPFLVLEELWHPHQVHGEVEEDDGLVMDEGLLRAAILGGEGFFRAARVGDEGFLKTGQEPGRCLRAIPGPPTQRIAARMETTVREVIL